VSISWEETALTGVVLGDVNTMGPTIVSVVELSGSVGVVVATIADCVIVLLKVADLPTFSELCSARPVTGKLPHPRNNPAASFKDPLNSN
jgi:hypothetical protein